MYKNVEVSPRSIGNGVMILTPSNLYDCDIEDNVFIGPFCEIQKGAVVGSGTRVQSHSFICEGVSIGKNCFISHGVMFINDKYPAPNKEGWEPLETIVGDDVSIGSNATIMPVRIGKGAVIGAGAVVIRDVPPFSVVAGNPARIIRMTE